MLVISSPQLIYSAIEIKAPLENLLQKLTPLATEFDDHTALSELQCRMTLPQISIEKPVLTAALDELEAILETHHKAITDDYEVQTLVDQIELCKRLVENEEALITISPSQIRAPRPPLTPGGTNPNVGNAYNGEPSTSPQLPVDVNIVNDLHVGNNASINGILHVEHNATIDGSLVITGGTQYSDDLVLQPIAPDTSIALRYNTNTGTELARFYTPSATTNGIVISNDTGTTEHLCVNNDGSTTLIGDLTITHPSANSTIALNGNTGTPSDWALISGTGGTDNLQIGEIGVGARIVINPLPGAVTMIGDVAVTGNTVIAPVGVVNLTVGGDAHIGATNGGLHVGGTSAAGTSNLLVDGTATTTASLFSGTSNGGLHVGGTSDPLDNNLVVDGQITCSGTIFANGGIDTPELGPTDTLNIGTTNAEFITAGRTSSSTTIGSTVHIIDKLPTLNNTGAASSASNAGIQLEEGGVVTGYSLTSADRASWTFKAPNTAGVATLTPGASGFTIDQPLSTADSPSFTGWTNANHGQLHLRELLVNGTNQVNIQAPSSLTSNVDLTLPSDAGTAGYIMTSTGPSGNLTWSPAGTTGSFFTQGGNGFAGSSPAILGTVDFKALSIITNATSRILIANNAGSGLITANTPVALDSNLNLDATTIITKNSSTFIHTPNGTSNLFMGTNAGNILTTGTNNTGIGDSALEVTNGSNNTALGYHALRLATSDELTAVGSNALSSCTSGTGNTAIGYNSLSTVETGSNNTALGYNSQAFATGSDNTAIGCNTLSSASFTGSDNTVAGSGAGSNLTQGNSNILLGKNAGSALTTESNTLCIGCPGVVGTSNATYIANIWGTTPNFSSKLVAVTLDNQLGTTPTALPPAELSIDGAAVFTGNTIFTADRIQTHNTTLSYGTSPGTTPDHYLGKYNTNSAAANFGATYADRLNFAFNYRDISPSGYQIPNASYGTVQMTVGPDISSNGGAFVIGTNVINTPPVSRFEVLPDGTINLASDNQINMGGSRFITQKATTSFYMGLNSGPTGTGGAYNTAVGSGALSNLTNGTSNTAIGTDAGTNVTTGTDNTLIGYRVGFGDVSKSNSIAIGYNEHMDSNNITIGNDNQNECIFFTGFTSGGNLKELHPAGSNLGSTAHTTTRLSMVFIDPLTPPVTFQGTSDILSVTKLATGSYRISYTSFGDVPAAVATDEQFETTVFNEWTVLGNVFQNRADVFTYNSAGSLADRRVCVMIAGYNSAP